MGLQFQRVGIHGPHSGKQKKSKQGCWAVASSSTRTKPRELTENILSILKPQSLLPVICLFQQGHTSESFPPSSTNWVPGIQTYELTGDAGGILTQATKPSNLPKVWAVRDLASRNNTLTSSTNYLVQPDAFCFTYTQKSFYLRQTIITLRNSPGNTNVKSELFSYISSNSHGMSLASNLRSHQTPLLLALYHSPKSYLPHVSFIFYLLEDIFFWWS